MFTPFCEGLFRSFVSLCQIAFFFFMTLYGLFILVMRPLTERIYMLHISSSILGLSFMFQFMLARLDRGLAPKPCSRGLKAPRPPEDVDCIGVVLGPTGCTQLCSGDHIMLRMKLNWVHTKHEP